MTCTFHSRYYCRRLHINFLFRVTFLAHSALIQNVLTFPISTLGLLIKIGVMVTPEIKVDLNGLDFDDSSCSRLFVKVDSERGNLLIGPGFIAKLITNSRSSFYNDCLVLAEIQIVG